QVVDIAQVSRYLEASQVSLAMFHDSLNGHVLTRHAIAQHDIGFHLFAPGFVGYWYGCGFCYLGQGVQHRLDFSRGDVLSGTPDHVFYSTDDIEIAALILLEQVAGTEPLAIKRRRRGLDRKRTRLNSSHVKV